MSDLAAAESKIRQAAGHYRRAMRARYGSNERLKQMLVFNGAMSTEESVPSPSVAPEPSPSAVSEPPLAVTPDETPSMIQPTQSATAAPPIPKKNVVLNEHGASKCVDGKRDEGLQAAKCARRRQTSRTTGDS